MKVLISPKISDYQSITVSVKDDFFSKLSSVFVNFIFNMFKWKTTNLNY